jgi:hypothetical protein
MEIQGIGLSAMDMLIAAHAIAAGCTLLSADRAFVQVPGLRVIDWSAAATPAQKVRDKLASAGITERDVEDAVAHARTTGRHAATKTKTKTAKKPKAK